MSINMVRIDGGITRPPESGYTAGAGTAWWRATIAHNQVAYSAQEGRQVIVTGYYRLQAWGAVAETVIDLNLGQGDEILVDGGLDQTVIKTADGKDDRKTRVKVAHVSVLRRAALATAAPHAGDAPAVPW